MQLKFIHDEDSEELKQLSKSFVLNRWSRLLSSLILATTPPRVLPDGTYDWYKTDLPQRLSKKSFMFQGNILGEHLLEKLFFWIARPAVCLFFFRS